MAPSRRSLLVLLVLLVALGSWTHVTNADAVRRLEADASGVADDSIVGSSASGDSSGTGAGTGSAGTTPSTSSPSSNGNSGSTSNPSTSGSSGSTASTTSPPPTTTTPTTTTKTPTTTTATPTTTTATPTTTTATPTTTTTTPTTTTKTPTTTTTAPPTTTSPPTTTAPPTTSSAPVVTTRAPTTTTEAPATTTSTPTSTTTQPSVVTYNSSTLPPDINDSNLNGSTVLWVEVTKTTNADGTVTYSYVVVTKVGDTIQRVNETALTSTSAPTATLTSLPGSSSGSTSTSSTSDQAKGAQASDGTTAASKTSGFSSGALVGVVVGGLVLTALLIGFFVLRRRQILRDRDSIADDDIIESPVRHDQARPYKSPSTWGINYQEVTSQTATTMSSQGTGPNRTRSSGSLWEDAVIVAARVPFDRVTIGELLGKGAYGEVYRGEFRDQKVAVKRLLPETRKNMVHIEGFLSEIRLLAVMEHPHIVQFVGVAWDSLSDLMCLTEFMGGGDLRSLLIEYQEIGHPVGYDLKKTNIALHVTHGLTYLHSLSPIVLHRDLKSRNILLTNSLQAKLTDFGVSRERSDRTMTAGVGSSLWMAPEVMMGMRYDEKADIFSLGVVMSELDTHQLPYSHAKESQTGAPMPDMAVLQLVTAGRLRVQLSERLLPSLRHLITECVNLDPRQRPTAAQALYELQMMARSLQ